MKNVRMTLVGVALLGYCQIGWAQQASKATGSSRRDAETSAGNSAPTSATANLGGIPAITSPGGMHVTPEMWFYEQERSRYEDPKAAVRRKAEFRASQREARLASLRWYGMSNSRPAASMTPFNSTYSPTYTSNTYDPFLWRPSTPSVLVVPMRTPY